MAAAIVDERGSLANAVSAPHNADLSVSAGYSEQDVEVLLATCWRPVRGLPAESRARLRGVGVAGQMHGCAIVDQHGRPVSPLYTWQDQRCEQTPGVITEPAARTGCLLSTGFAPATMAWLVARDAVPSEAVLPSGVHLETMAATASWQTRPHPDGLYLAVAASLAGGSAWKWLAGLCASWTRDLGCTPSDESAAYDRLNSLGAAAAAAGEGASLVASQHA